MNSTPPFNRSNRPRTTEEQARQGEQRALIAAELPTLIERDRLGKEAQEEPTLSGELRRAIHGSKRPLADLAASAGITPVQLDEFLTGERTLRSDALDRLASALGFQFQKAT